MPKELTHIRLTYKGVMINAASGYDPAGPAGTTLWRPR